MNPEVQEGAPGPQINLAFALGLASYTVYRSRLIPNPKPPLHEIHEYVFRPPDAPAEEEPFKPRPTKPVEYPMPTPVYGEEWIGGRPIGALKGGRRALPVE